MSWKCSRCSEKNESNRARNGRKFRAWCRACDAKRVRSSYKNPIKIEKTAYQQYRSQQIERERRDSERIVREALEKENAELKAKVQFLSKVTERPPQILVYRQPKHKRSDSIACAIASDWHVEEEVQKASVHGLNEYNLDVAKERARLFFQNYLRMTDIVAHDAKVNTMFLYLGGDFFSGWIHEELLAANLLAPADAARFCLGLLMSGIDFLLKESSYVIEIDAIPGNHGRLTKQVFHSNPTGTSLETFMYAMLAARYEGNPRIRIRVADHAMIYRKFYENFMVRMIHGYEVKYGGGVGGITVPVNKALAQWDKAIKADLTLMGHFHQFMDGGRFLVNGSMVGYGTYSQFIKAEFEEPRQAFFTIHARGGGEKALVAPVWVTEKPK